MNSIVNTDKNKNITSIDKVKKTIKVKNTAKIEFIDKNRNGLVKDVFVVDNCTLIGPEFLVKCPTFKMDGLLLTANEFNKNIGRKIEFSEVVAGEFNKVKKICRNCIHRQR